MAANPTPAETLSARIKAEFAAHEGRKKAMQEKRLKEDKDVESRLQKFTAVCADLATVWGPRLDEFAKQFGDQIKIVPTITPSAREAKMVFLTPLANMTLTLTASAGVDATKLILDYDLLIVPIFFQYDRHARLEMPIDKIDRDAVTKWIDDRLLSCVKAYLEIQDNEQYIKRAMVEDPITHARFLPQDAAVTFTHNGQMHYFAAESSLVEFKKRHMITA